MVRIERDDPFIGNFFQQIAPQIAQSFTVDQLAAIKMVYAAKAWGRHTVDIRFSFPFFWQRYYVVFIAGRDKRAAARRALDRKSHPLATIGNVVVTLIFLVVLGVPAFLIFDAVLAALAPGGAGSQSFVGDLFGQIRELFR